MPALSTGVYRISFTNEQLLTVPDLRPGAPLMLLPPDAGPPQEWVVSNGDNDTYTISPPNTALSVSYDGEPDMHEPAIMENQPRRWRLTPGEALDTYFIAVPDAPMRLGLSLLRIFPPRVALAPEYDDRYQAWTFTKVN